MQQDFAAPGPDGGAAVASERRLSPRTRTVCLSVKINRSDDEGLFWARNLSDQGMMFGAQVKFDPGERLSIEMSQNLAVDGSVEWYDQGCCGVRFAQDIDSAAFLEGLVTIRQEYRRSARRLSIKRLATCYSDRGVKSVTLTDVSSHGLGLSHSGWLERGSSAKFVLESGLARSGRVCWSSLERAGIFLDEPFARDELESSNDFGNRGLWTRP